MGHGTQLQFQAYLNRGDTSEQHIQMKMSIVLPILMATSWSVYGQFIPQQMGYNPDVNGDEFIGVDDVMGTLALFGNTFNNGDSLEIEHLTFSTFQASHFQIPNQTDVLYIDYESSNWSVAPMNFALPQGEGFKSLLIFMGSDVPSGQGTHWQFFNADGQSIYSWESLGQSRGFAFLIRGTDGKWYSNAP